MDLQTIVSLSTLALLVLIAAGLFAPQLRAGWKKLTSVGKKIGPHWLWFMSGIALTCLVIIGIRFLPTITIDPWWKPKPGPVAPVDPSVPSTALVAIIYESEDGNLPPYAIGAVNQLRAAGREVRVVDDDVTDGTDQTPDWLKPALEPAKAAGLPALVLLNGGKAVKAVKLPATTEAILEAAL